MLLYLNILYCSFIVCNLYLFWKSNLSTLNIRKNAKGIFSLIFILSHSSLGQPWSNKKSNKGMNEKHIDSLKLWLSRFTKLYMHVKKPWREIKLLSITFPAQIFFYSNLLNLLSKTTVTIRVSTTHLIPLPPSSTFLHPPLYLSVLLSSPRSEEASVRLSSSMGSL